MYRLTEGPIDDVALKDAVSHRGAGAVVVFHGTVRDESRGRRVTHLVYEAYPPMALSEMRAIGDAVTREFGLSGIACVHRIGRLEPGETAVVLAASAPHRKAALDAVEAFVARLKREVPIWKQEWFEDGAVWVGTPDDPQGERAEVAAR